MRKYVVITTGDWPPHGPPLPGSTVDIAGRPYRVIGVDGNRLTVEEV